jgi:hypothetical protein
MKSALLSVLFGKLTARGNAAATPLQSIYAFSALVAGVPCRCDGHS